MEQVILGLVIIAGLLAYNQISNLTKKIQRQEERINELARLTGHENLSTCVVSEDVKELVLQLKQTEKEVEAVKKVREHTNMTLVEAKEYVDQLT